MRRVVVLLALTGCAEAPGDTSEFQAALGVAWPILVEHARPPRLVLLSGDQLDCLRNGIPGFSKDGACFHGLSWVDRRDWAMWIAVVPGYPPAESALCHEVNHFALSLTEDHADGDPGHTAPGWEQNEGRCKDVLRATPPPPSP